MLSMTELKKLASSTQVYFRGTDYAQGGRVTILEEEYGTGITHTVSAQVRGSSNTRYHIFLELSEDDSSLLQATCTCPAFEQYEGLCKHLVATLVTMAEEASTPDPFSPRGALRKKKQSAQVPATDQAALSLMREYARKSAAQLLPGAGEPLVAIEPTLEISSNPLRLSFRVGSRRLYVLKDLDKFRNAAATGAELTYGKSLHFVHHPSRFQPESLPLYKFILSQPSSSYTYYGGPDWRRFLQLTPHSLDEFFRLYGPENPAPLLVSLDGTTLVCRLQEGQPELHLWLRRQKNGGLLLSLREDIHLLRGLDFLYLLCGETIYQCSGAYREACEELLSTLCKSRRGLTLLESDLKGFYSCVLRSVSPYLEIESRLDLTAYEPLPMTAALYLDLPAPGLATARLKFRYGETEYDGFRARDLLASRDIRGEYAVEELIRPYFPPADPETGILEIQEDEDALYRLVAEGLEQLGARMEIYATDAFRGVRVQPRSTVQVGVRVSSGLLELDFSMEGIQPEELAEILRSYRTAKRYHRLRDGSFLNLEDPAIGEFSEMAEGLNLDAADLRRGHAKLPEYRTLYLDALLKQSDRIRYDRDNAFRRIARDMRDVADSDFEIPPTLKPILRHYQKTGYRWLRTIAAYGFGGILADDMGLGKTIQVLALLLSWKDGAARPVEAEAVTPPPDSALPLPAEERKTALVVCPSSLVLNWVSEVQKFAPSLRCLPVLGTAPQREALLQDTREVDLIVTSYDLLKRDIEQYQAIPFAFEIIDEAQYIKNPSTQNAKAVKAVNSQVRLALTGTPVENSLADLWSIYDYLMPGYLYSYNKFRKMLETPIVRENAAAAAERLRKLVHPFILRRMKQEVLQELPEKVETVLYAEMCGEQQKLYLANALEAKSQLGGEAGLSGGKIMILALLTRLRQLCCDPSLLYEDYTGGSGKRELCMELVENCVESGHKLLLFSQFTSMLAIIEKELVSRKIPYYQITGATPAAERLELVNAFNADQTPVFLISLKAGGTGLNLTGADVVIHYDPWWNLSAQNQATDRVHRIGQKNSVQVYRLIAKGSIEEKILQMQETKAKLSADIIQEGAGILSDMTPDEILSLFE